MRVYQAFSDSYESGCIPRRWYVEQLACLPQMGKVEREGPPWVKNGAPLKHIDRKRMEVWAVGPIAEGGPSLDAGCHRRERILNLPERVQLGTCVEKPIEFLGIRFGLRD